MSDSKSFNNLQIKGDEVIVGDNKLSLKSRYYLQAEEVQKKLNAVSGSMCLAKWYFLTINLTTGRTQSCYHPLSHEVSLEELAENPSALHNTKFKKQMRAQMLKGERPAECVTCWNVEDANNHLEQKHLSDRAYRSADVYSEELLTETIQAGADTNPIPLFLEVSFSNKCQMKCSYCSPYTSSSWEAELREIGSYKITNRRHNNLDWFEKNNLLPDAKKSEIYINNFWRWWPEVYKTLKHLKISGGEPLLDENTFRIFDFISNSPKTDLQFSINSNCCVADDIWDTFVQRIKKMGQATAFDHFMLFCSLDSIADQAEYIRYGLSYQKLMNNIEQFVSDTERTSLTFIITTNALSIVGLKRLLQVILDLRKKFSHQRQKIWFDVPTIKHPEFLNVNVLPISYEKYLDECVQFMQENLETQDCRFHGFKDFELAKVKSLKDLFVNSDSTQQKRCRADLYLFLKEHDLRRKTNYQKTFPEMLDFFDICQKDSEDLREFSDREENLFELTPQFKSKLMDPISPTFCAAKWYNATIWLGAGKTASCHHPAAHAIPLSELEISYKALHNTAFKKQQRALMLQGKRPAECEYCWKIEDLPSENTSDRVLKTIIYKEKDILALKNSDHNKNFDLKTLEIAFDRTCQLACSYCNGGYSSTWVKDIRENGAYHNLPSDKSLHYSSLNDWGQAYLAHETNPYIEAFWKWWSELSHSLFELRVTGGEPLLSSHYWRLVDWFVENSNSEIRFATNSNLSVRPELIQRLLEKSHSVRNFDLYTSCEAKGVQAEYIRDGLNYEIWKQNLTNLIKNGKFRRVVIMMTVNVLSLDSMTEFIDDMMELKKKYGSNYAVLSLNILRYPSFQSVAILPKNLKLHYAQKIQNWFKKSQIERLISQSEVEQINRLIHYLEAVEEPHPQALSVEQLRSDFKSFYQQYDQRRQKDFAQTFSGVLGDWMKILPFTK